MDKDNDIKESEMIEARQKKVKLFLSDANDKIGDKIRENQYYEYICNMVKNLNENYLPDDHKIVFGDYCYSYKHDNIEINIDFFIDDLNQRENPIVFIKLSKEYKDKYLVSQISEEIKRLLDFNKDISWTPYIKDIYYGDDLYDRCKYINHYQYLGLLKAIENNTLQNIDKIMRAILLSFNIISAEFLFDIQ